MTVKLDGRASCSRAMCGLRCRSSRIWRRACWCGRCRTLEPFAVVPVHRWVEAPADPPIAWVSFDGDDRPWEFVFGGRFTLPWPFPDVGLVFE